MSSDKWIFELCRKTAQPWSFCSLSQTFSSMMKKELSSLWWRFSRLLRSTWIRMWVCMYTCVCVYYDCYCFFNSSLQEGTGRPVASNRAITCAELVLDVSPKTQRVILKKKVRELRTWSLEEKIFSPGRDRGHVVHPLVLQMSKQRPRPVLRWNLGILTAPVVVLRTVPRRLL